MIRRISAATFMLVLVTGICLAHADPVTVTATTAGPLRQSMARIQAEPVKLQAFPAARPRLRGSTRQHVFATMGAFAGLVGGGYLGAKIEGDRCRCDDPGLTGFIIGAPIGAIVGGVIGYKLGE